MAGRPCRRGGRVCLGQAAPIREGVHPQILKQARQSGQLNLSNHGLSEVPASVWRINVDVTEESKNVCLDNSDDRWWEQVDLMKLILASNSLTCLSEDIILLPALTVLDVHDNSLKSLPNGLANLVNIHRLNISHNKLARMPDCVHSLRQLKVLLASHNVMEDLGDGIRHLGDLEELDVSNNKLVSLSPGVAYLSKLMKLNVSDNLLSVLPDGIGDLNKLRSVDATQNQLTCLPSTLGSLMYLEQLHLRHNKLNGLPHLKLCHGLKELYVGNNAIVCLSVENLECLNSLSVLDIRDNKIKTLPDEITLLTNLERLDLTNNDLSTLPYTLGSMTKLKFIVLDGNPMKSIRRDIIQRGTNELKKYLHSRLDEEPVGKNEKSGVKSSQGLSGVIGGSDADLLDPFTVATTKKLDYSNKKATVIPDDVWSIISDKDVATIDFSKNLLTELPSNLRVGADNLKDLNLGFNKMALLSDQIGIFVKLTYLDLRNNQLSELPSVTSNLQQLQCIILSSNRFANIPDILYDLSKLENITINDNRVSELDVSGLSRLSVLSVLNVQNNNISLVPPELGNLEQLRSVQLDGNAFRVPRPAILARGTGALLEYLRGRIPGC